MGTAIQVDKLVVEAQDLGSEVRYSWGGAYLLLFVVYVALGLLLRWAGWIHSDASWFVAAARKILDGSFDLYSFRAMPDLIPPGGATYAYSPLTAMIIAPFVGLADALGWGQ